MPALALCRMAGTHVDQARHRYSRRCQDSNSIGGLAPPDGTANRSGRVASLLLRASNVLLKSVHQFPVSVRIRTDREGTLTLPVPVSAACQVTVKNGQSLPHRDSALLNTLVNRQRVRQPGQNPHIYHIVPRHDEAQEIAGSDDQTILLGTYVCALSTAAVQSCHWKEQANMQGDTQTNRPVTPLRGQASPERHNQYPPQQTKQHADQTICDHQSPLPRGTHIADRVWLRLGRLCHDTPHTTHTYTAHQSIFGCCGPARGKRRRRYGGE